MEEKHEITDEELDRIAAKVRSIRRRETMAKAVGVILALVLTPSLFALTFLVVPGGEAGRWRAAVAALGVVIGGFAYRVLAPKEDPNDVE
jgi:hypothetical protein